MSLPPRQKNRRLLAGLLLLLPAAWLALHGTTQDSGPERDKWQRPDEVMDKLAIHAGSAVADVGCGEGYFTFKLAARVGPQGKVYAEDINHDVLASIRRQTLEEKLPQVETILGAPDDPKLPSGSVDVVLVVNSYHEWRQYDAMLQHLYQALRPGGLLGLIDGTARPGQPRSAYYEHHRMPEQIERDDATRNGFHFLRQEAGFLRGEDKKEFYFLVFEKPKPDRPASTQP